MNLGQYLVQQLLEAEQTTIALFPGAFKPPHKGHFAVVKKLLENADQVTVLISPKTREGITADESVAVWELYKTLLDGSVEIRVAAENPVRETYDVIKNNPDTNFIVAFGKNDADRFRQMNKNPNAKVFDAGTFEGQNATGLRAALLANNEDAIKQFLPDGVDIADFLMALSKAKKEEIPTEEPAAAPATEPAPVAEYKSISQDDTFANYVLSKETEIEQAAQDFNIPIPDVRYAFTTGNMVILTDEILSKLENKDHHGEDKGDGPAMILNYDKDKYYLVYGSHLIHGEDPKVLMAVLNLEGPKPFPLKEGKLNESETATIGEFIKYAIKNLGIQNPPRNLSLSYDTNKAKEMRSFGYFSPNDNKIWVYCANRNMADILRTLAHELVHRKQDEDGRISYESGKTGSEIENEANAMAGVLLRDFGKQHEEIYQ
jgi:cytidyltransferase-like protein